MDEARRPTGRGGWRRGAGRPRGRTKVGHITRERFAARYPLHVTLRVAEGVGSLRKGRVVKVVRGVIAAGGRRDAFRVVEFNVLGNHVHLVVEAGGAEALARGMQGLNVRLARRINAVLGRSGKLFAERYHARSLRTPRDVRNVLRYVLLNARHHAAERGETMWRGWVDPCSSGAWFHGWKGAMRRDVEWLELLRKETRPTAVARTWLLVEGWKKNGGGLIGIDEVP